MTTLATPPQEFVNSSAVLAPNTKLALKELPTDALSSTALKEVTNVMLELVVTPGSASATLVPLALMMALLLIAHLDHSARLVLPVRLPMLDFATQKLAMTLPTSAQTLMKNASMDSVKLLLALELIPTLAL
jgi:hypothetical protein